MSDQLSPIDEDDDNFDESDLDPEPRDSFWDDHPDNPEPPR